MIDSFWTGGPDANANALHKQYEPVLSDLRRRRDVADDSEQAELDAEIARTESEYKSTLDLIDDALF